MNVEKFYKNINDATERSYPKSTIPQLIDRQAEGHANSIAVLSGDEIQTYENLRLHSNIVASYLKRQGIGAGDLVGVCCNRDVDTPSLLIGIMKAGAGYVPLDPDYPVNRLQFMVQDSGVKHVLGNEPQRKLLASFETPCTILDDEFFNREGLSKEQIAANGDEASIDDVAYVIYTSGSTGKPKGVAVPHGAVANMLWSMVESPGFTAKDRILATTTLSFDISVVEFFLPLISGGSVAIVDRQTAKDTVALVAAIKHHDVTFMQATPAMWRMIVEADFRGRPDLKFVTAGEPLPRDLIQPMLDRCGEVWNLYGPTETTVYSSGTQVFNDVDPILIGPPIANTQVYIVDENGDLCAPEIPGELLIGGDGMTLGYMNRPVLNEQKFIVRDGQTVYRTGDLAKMTADGQINHMGRIDNQIKYNGHRIELGEIDAAIAAQPGVRQAASVVREDRPGDKRLVGYLLREAGESPNLGAIRKTIGELLPDYMVPDLLTVVKEFPHTPSGKLDRSAFNPPSKERPDTGVEYIPPSSDDEKTLEQIWADILQFEKIGVTDNFFDLGGNSIRAVKAVAMAREKLGSKVTGAEFFDNPTIRGFLSLAEKKQAFASSLSGAKTPIEKNVTSTNQYAIVGLAARMPGAKDLNQFWNNLVEGKESIRFFKPDELDATLDPRDTQDPNYVPARGIIDDADHFDARFFRTTPRNAELTCPQQRIMLELAWSALEDAGHLPNNSEHRVGIWAGTYSTSYYTKNLLTNPDIVRDVGEFQLGVYNEKDYIATRVAHALNFTGPAINVNTACSTSLVALIEACKSLSAGHCDVALAGGASVAFPQNSGHLHQTGSIFTPDGHCRPFDADGAGTLFSDGAGVVVVKRLEDAKADGDRIYAVVKGFGINNDGGEKASFSAPSITGQADAVAMAHRMADVDVESIGYVEAHGTATPIGDPIEVSALRTVFEAQTDKKQFCAIGSVKSNIGHTVAAAGVAGLIKTALSLHHQQIPGNLHYQKPNPQIDFESSPFYVCDSLTQWPTKVDQPRRAGVSAFGVGGTNAHVLLEEAPETIHSSDPIVNNRLPVAILPMSGKTQAALDETANNLGQFLLDNVESTDLSIDEVANSLQHGRQEFQYRAAFVSGSNADAGSTLLERKPGRFFKRKAAAVSPEVVFMFPGQGSQYVRMGQGLYHESSVFKEHLDACAEILLPLLGRDLRDVLFPESGDEEASQEILKNTQFTQPALFSLGFSLAQMWLAWGIKPACMMGHSIGEFAAACVGGVFELEDGLKMIAQRGAAMQALPGGTMMSVSLPGAEVEPLLWGDMAIGSFNGPKLCVVAGPDDQVLQLQEQLESRDVVCRRLHTSHAFHSPMMQSIVKPFAEFVGQFKLSPPKIPILSTVTGDWMTDMEATDPNYWADHLRMPVRFSEAVTKMWDEDSTRVLVELGPRRTLATLSKQHAKDPKNQIAVPSLSNTSEGNAEWDATLSAVAQLWTAGVDIVWSKLSSNDKPVNKSKHVSLPTYPFQRKRYFIQPGTVGIPIGEIPIAVNASPPPDIFCSTSNQPATPQVPLTHKTTMTRIPNIVAAIKNVFENTSGFDLDEFDGDTTFFEMGLDSLVLTQTATALKKAMNFEVTFRQLLEETPTVDSLADWLDQNLPADQLAAVAVAEPEPMPPPLASTTPDEIVQLSSAAAPEPQVVTATSSAPVSMNMQPLAADGFQTIVQNQLQLMAAQLQLLSGGSGSVNPGLEVAQPTTEAVQTAAVPVAPSCAAPEVGAEPTETKKTFDKAAEPKAKRFSTVKTADGKLNDKQQKALDQIIGMNNTMLAKSKAYAQQHRKYMADPRTVSGFRPNMKEMTHPIVVERSKGALLWDIDGNEYVDFTCGFGSNILGHTHEITVEAITKQVKTDYAIGPQSPLAGEVAKLFCEITGNERMAFSNTGSEAVLGCTRLARNATGRDLIVMFNGDYHGILDEVIARGSKNLKSYPAATGIPKDHVGNTLILDYGSSEALQIIRDRIDEIAGILVEPVQSRMPELQPKEFLQELRTITQDDPACLIFDEVISGLRIGLGGAQEHFGIEADLASYGKIVGGGMPIGIVAGKAEYMDGLDGGFWQYGDDSRPEAGMTYFAGTFVRHPLTLAASKAILEHLKSGGQPMYDRLNDLSQYLADEMNRVFESMEAPMFLANFGSLFKIQFHQELVYSEIFFAGLRRRGMHIWDHRPCLLTLAHDRSHIDQLVIAMQETIAECQRYGFMPGDGYKNVSTSFQADRPPQVGAKVGKDNLGNQGWFVADSMNPGQFVQVGLPAN